MNSILPHVSRRAVKRVTNPLPAPTHCPYCDGAVSLVENREIYGRSYGEWPYAYHCSPCNAYVGLHPHTDIPLGTLANKKLREARKENKDVFHTMMKVCDFTRSAAYEWLASAMDIRKEDCHFGWFNLEQCDLAGQLCHNKLNGVIA